MPNRRSEFETAIVITGTDKGGIKVIQATGEEVKKLNLEQERGADKAKKYGNAQKKAGKDTLSFGNLAKRGFDIAAKAAGVFTGALTALVTINTKAIAESVRTAQQLGVSSQSFQAQAHMAKLAGVEMQEYGDVLRDVTVRVREFASIGTGEGADFFEALNLDIEEFKDLAPDELLKAIGHELKDLNRNDKLLFLDQLGSDNATRLIDVIDQLDAMEQEAIALGVALSDVDAEQVNQANIGLEKAQSVFKGTANQITAGLAPIVTDLTSRFYDAAVEAGGVGVSVDDFVAGAVDGIGLVADIIQQLEIYLKQTELAWLSIGATGTQAMANNAEAVAEVINTALYPFQKSLALIADGWGAILFGMSKLGGPFKKELLSASDSLAAFSRDVDTFQVDTADLIALNQNVQAGVVEARAELQDLLNAPPPSEQLAQWYEEVKARAEELAEATLEANAAQGESVEVTSQQASAVEDLIEQMEFENLLLGKTTLEQKIENNIRKAGAAATEEQRQAIRRLTIERHREEQVIAQTQEQLKRLDDIRSNQIENFQRAFETGIVDTIKAGKVELEDFIDILESGLVSGFAGNLSAGVTNFLFNGGQGSGGGGFNAMDALGLAGSWEAISGAAGAVAGAAGFGTLGTTGGWVAPSMANPATLAASGAPSGIASGAMNFLTNPWTLGIGSLLAFAASNDFWSDPDGFKNSMAGMLVGPTPNANPNGLFSVDPFASGFAPTGFADRRTKEEARAVIDLFRALDGSLDELIALLGGQVDLSQATLAGLGVEGRDGTNGTFLGQGGRTDDITNQFDSYTRQFLAHVSGINQELIDAALAAGSFEQAMEILGNAVEEHTGLQVEQAEILEANYDRLEASIARGIQQRAQVDSLLAAIDTDLGLDPIYGDSIDDRIRRVTDLRQAAIDHYNEQIALERQLHDEKMAFYEMQLQLSESATRLIDSLMISDISPLSATEKEAEAKRQFYELSQTAGDSPEDFARFEQAAQEYLRIARSNKTGSDAYVDIFDQVTGRVEALRDEFALAVKPEPFDEAEAQAELHAALYGLQDELISIKNSIALDQLSILFDINETLENLPDEIYEKLATLFDAELVASIQIATDLGILRDDIVAALGLLPNAVDLSNSGVAAAIEAITSLSLHPEFLTDSLGKILFQVAEMLISAGASSYLIADQIAEDPALTAAANDYLGDNNLGTVADYQSSVNPHVTDEQIQDYADELLNSGKTEQEIIEEFVTQANAHGVGSKQVADALGMDQAEVINHAVSAGASIDVPVVPAVNPDVEDWQIQQFAEDLLNSGKTEQEIITEFVNAAVANGVGSGQAAGALGMDQAQVLDFARSVGLPDFDIGTDRVLKDMPANIHQGEIIIEPARSDRIRAEIESRVSGSGSQQLVSAVTELMQVVQSSRQDLRLTIVAADGKVLTEQVLEDVWSRSQRGERVLHVDGLVGSAA